MRCSATGSPGEIGAMVKAHIAAIRSALPDGVLDNDQLAAEYPGGPRIRSLRRRAFEHGALPLRMNSLPISVYVPLSNSSQT